MLQSILSNGSSISSDLTISIISGKIGKSKMDTMDLNNISILTTLENGGEHSMIVSRQAKTDKHSEDQACCGNGACLIF